MKKKIYRSLLMAFTMLLGVILFMSSCVRDGLDECDVTGAQIRIEFDYSYAGIPRTGTTAVFYPVGNTPTGEKVSISTHNSSAMVSLQSGEYSVLVINETFSDFNNVKFRNTEDYSKAEAYVEPVDVAAQSNSDALYYSPEILVVDTLSSFIVTPEMAAGISKIFTLRRAVAPVNVVLHIKDMQYIRTATSSISGFSEGQLLASRQNNTTGVTHGLENVKLTYNDESKANGVITGSFNTFGLNPDNKQTYRLTFDALLIDGKTTVHKEFDIRDIIKINKDKYGISIDIELGSKEKPLIEIPKVKAEEGTSPFDPDVDDWEENEDIDIPLH